MSVLVSFQTTKCDQMRIIFDQTVFLPSEPIVIGH